jgi:hypothetical protein
MEAVAGYRIELPRGDRPMPPPGMPGFEARAPFGREPVLLQDALAGLPSTLRDLPVLLVDDDGTTLELLRMIFETYGARVTGARNAEEAIVALQGAPHDAPYGLLLSDIGLPGMDGFEMMRCIRGRLRLPAQRLPAVAVTAWARAEDRAMALRCGYQAHLPKPYEAEQLVATSMRLLGRSACALN